ncbi:carboxysome peptide B [Thiomicrospira cyclica]|jgi:carboxysome peptide B|uniref:Carboxysome peptide B n=1 Tax=Thiomicrospira cyclica (strain DSM 14477 / JCM 11371 / ALM1) TaxID=717773 RepID=F6DAY5_THICA|nr:carboxysome peptide B [Thiomicrospira cyclica]AEG32318.1 carboxysome peptide B [Thiomicrospira cyclica ALM1]
MEIHQVTHQLILTSRLEDLGHLPVKVLKSVSGGTAVALDPIGCKVGEWVFTIANSAARTASGDDRFLTDLTISGIIDNWPLDVDKD